MDSCLYSEVSTFRRYNTYPLFVFDAQAMWIHVYIVMYPHSKNNTTLICFDMWIHVYIVMYPHLEDTLILYVLAKMWIHVYIARYPHLEDIQHIPFFVLVIMTE